MLIFSREMDVKTWAVCRNLNIFIQSEGLRSNLKIILVVKRSYLTREAEHI